MLLNFEDVPAHQFNSVSRKKKRHKISATPAVANSAALPDQAALALGASRYKDAIEIYKDLLKRERQPAWLDGLAAAYAGRAAQLAAKGMIKEALALWQTRAAACGTPVLDGPYVSWLIQSGETERALRYMANATTVAPEMQAHLELQLAGVVLVAADSALAGLAVDSPLLTHRGAALAALAACARGDDAAMAEHLQAIPFRSPYRDLRTVLKALALLGSDINQAAQVLARVPAHGAFESLAAVVRACVLSGQEWLAALYALDEDGRAMLLDLKGYPAERRALVLELAKLRDAPPSAVALHDLLVRHRRALNDSTAAQLCRRLLPHAPERLKAHEASFGKLPVAERARVLALAAELQRHPDHAEDHWLDVVEHLNADSAGRQRAALVLRRLADNPEHRESDGTPCEHGMEWLGRSLELDPDDRATYLRLIRALRARGDVKATRLRLEQALGRFPKDAELLLEAVETALAGGAFKKAVGLAKRVLELDPINPRVRAVVGHAHLSHARKQIAARNPAAAPREIDAAAQWLRAVADRGSIKLLRALIEDRNEDGDALLREGFADLGGALVGSFHVLIEAERTQRDPDELLRRAGADLDMKPGAAEIVALAHALNAVTDDPKTVRAALGPLRGIVGRATAVSFSETDHLLVCEALHRHDEHDLARRYAEAALKRWPGRPVFVYLKAASAYGKHPSQLPPREVPLLEQALAQAQAQGDHRVVLRLGDFLAKATGEVTWHDEFDADAPDGLDDAATKAMLEMMLALGGEDEFLDMARRQLGKTAYYDLRREIGGNKKQFARALVDLLASPTPTLGAADPGANPAFPASPVDRPRRKPLSPSGQKDLFDD